MVKKYRKKPVEVEAIRFVNNTESLLELSEFVKQDIRIDYSHPTNPCLYIETLEGIMKASVGDYIIRGVHGEYYPCKPDIFAKTYEPVE